MSSAFFEADGDRYVSTDLTRGPWAPNAQHAGPTSALIGRAVERCPGGEDKQVGRITFEILRPIPIAPLAVQAEVVRPGQRVDLVQATLTHDGTELVRARAWRVRSGKVLDPPAVAAPPGPPPPPSAGTEQPFFDTGQDVGYHTAMEWRFVSGGFREPGPATVWLRMRHPLVPDEDPSPLQRVLIAADSGNGVSAILDPMRYLFINTDLSVHLHRMPDGDWVCLDARTILPGGAVGMADTSLSDERGGIGRGLQTLYVARREDPVDG